MHDCLWTSKTLIYNLKQLAKFYNNMIAMQSLYIIAIRFNRPFVERYTLYTCIRIYKRLHGKQNVVFYLLYVCGAVYAKK